jgi:hypothetical protein
MARRSWLSAPTRCSARGRSCSWELSDGDMRPPAGGLDEGNEGWADEGEVRLGNLSRCGKEPGRCVLCPEIGDVVRLGMAGRGQCEEVLAKPVWIERFKSGIGVDS